MICKYQSICEAEVCPLIQTLTDCNSGLPRNLYQCKLLVEHGANVNRQVPNEILGNSNKSPLEHLIDLISYVCCKIERLSCRYLAPSNKKETVPNFIGLNNETNMSWHETRLQLLELLEQFLEFSGDPNSFSAVHNVTLFHKALTNTEPDLDVIRMLSEAGGDLGKCSRHGFTPLMGLLQTQTSDLSLQILEIIWPTAGDTVDVNKEDCVGNTAQWCAMMACSPGAALFLIDRGASLQQSALSPAVSLMLHFLYITSDEYKLSPLFAPLTFQSGAHFKYYAAVSLQSNGRYIEEFSAKNQGATVQSGLDKCLMIRILESSVSPVVDMDRTSNLAETDFGWLVDEFTCFCMDYFKARVNPPAVVGIAGALFGVTTTSLQQLCARVIIDQMFFNCTFSDAIDLLRKLHGSEPWERPFPTAMTPIEVGLAISSQTSSLLSEDECIINKLLPFVLKNLTRLLGLPMECSTLFELEAARLQICSKLHSFTKHRNTAQVFECMSGGSSASSRSSMSPTMGSALEESDWSDSDPIEEISSESEERSEDCDSKSQSSSSLEDGCLIGHNAVAPEKSYCPLSSSDSDHAVMQP